jgi:hypothetical protein
VASERPCKRPAVNGKQLILQSRDKLAKASVLVLLIVEAVTQHLYLVAPLLSVVFVKNDELIEPLVLHLLMA